MLFVANALPLNGGTTFLIRACKELSTREERPDVLILFEPTDALLLKQLSQYANIYFLKDYSKLVPDFLFNKQAGVFLFKNFSSLDFLLKKNKHIHTMGAFGLLFVSRWLRSRDDDHIVSVGIYHQNEFLYRGVNWYFSKSIQNVFVNISPAAIIFFNEHCKSSYDSFFNRDHFASKVLPIGIDLPRGYGSIHGSPDSYSLVSIGNLHGFKTYNRHIIECMPRLLKINPEIKYHIYGDGPCREELSTLVHKLDLDASVFFHGSIPYDKMPEALNKSLAFIGSGTAIIEASALGIPSIIGIESGQESVTYGFFNDTIGFSYQEIMPGKKEYFYLDLITQLVCDQRYWHQVAEKCMIKAADFSIARTIDGFVGLEKCKESYFTKANAYFFNNALAFFSWLICGIFDAIGIDKTFSTRRNQGSIF